MARRETTRCITIDRRWARLFACSRTERGSLHLEEVASLRSEWEDSHQRSRPSMLQQGPATAPAHLVESTRAVAEETRQFARQVSRWIRLHLVDGGPIVGFADPQFMGTLREVDPRLGGLVTLRAGELTRLNASELSGHPAVIEALAALPPPSGEAPRDAREASGR